MGALQGCLSRGGQDIANRPGPVDSNGGGTFAMDYGQAPQQNSTADNKNTKAVSQEESPAQVEQVESKEESPIRIEESVRLSKDQEARESVTQKYSYISPVKVHTRSSASYLEEVPEPEYVQREPDEEDTFAEYTDTLEDEEMAAPQVKLQKPAPFFKGTAVVNGEFKEISLDDYKGKYVVLFFYPLDFTFVCPTEIIAFSDRAEDFHNIGCEVIAASTDSHFSHLAWVNTPRKAGGLGKMDIPMLADKNGEIAKKYGIYKDDEGIAFRGLFIIDDEQRLRQITVNDLPVGRSVDETFRLVQAFQFTDKHGEVCPAGWKPGSKTIKPTVEDSKNYFKNSE